MVRRFIKLNVVCDLFILVLFFIFLSCGGSKINTVAVEATTINNNDRNYYGIYDLLVEINKDSSFKIVDFSVQINDSTLEVIDPLNNPKLLENYTYEGKAIINGNKINFKNLNYFFNSAELKNGFMVLYTNGTFFKRLLLKQSDFQVNNYYSKRMFSDYALFNAPKDSLYDCIYNLNQNDLVIADSIILSAANLFKPQPLQINEYYKQLKVFSNKDSTIILVDIFPKSDITKTFEYYPFRSFQLSSYDGAYGSVRINLTHHSHTPLEYYEN